MSSYQHYVIILAWFRSMVANLGMQAQEYVTNLVESSASKVKLYSNNVAWYTEHNGTSDVMISRILIE